jgi:hypothetical protein
MKALPIIFLFILASPAKALDCFQIARDADLAYRQGRSFSLKGLAAMKVRNKAAACDSSLQAMN